MNLNSKIRVSGNIISELSEKIPSNIIALNELIKNSYDAGASYVTINLDTEARELLITDNGSGMDAEDINTLFHISNSKKSMEQLMNMDVTPKARKVLGSSQFLNLDNMSSGQQKKTLV
ncbi:ATP-binding protein [Nitratidesulfovibrio sp. D1]|uniref:ATP-binding protein n=1 Tax=Nitratidesulfovibrio sp. D1 TaxID=3440151 RepID=UPI003EBD9B3A